jgi:ABC-type multidrug transport system ATPase subunit
MGVCPQFDVLWQQLSGWEHLVIYGLVKGLQFDQVSLTRLLFKAIVYIVVYHICCGSS